MKRSVKGLVVIFTLSVYGTATAQEDAALRSLARKITAEGQVIPALRDPGSLAAQGSPEPAIVFVALQEGAVAKARFGYLLSGIESIDVTLSGPVRKGTAVFADASGLSPGVDAKVKYQRILWQREVGLRAPSEAEAAGQLTSASSVAGLLLEDELKAGTEITSEQAFNAAVRLASGIQRIGGAQVLSAFGDVGALALFSVLPGAAKLRYDPDQVGGSIVEGLTSSLRQDQAVDVDVLAARLQNPSGREAFALAWRALVNGLGLRKVTNVVLATGSFEAGHRKFTFVDDGAVTPQDTNRISRTWEAAVGFMQNRAKRETAAAADAGLYVGGSISGGATYEGKPASSVCTSYAGDALRCTNVAIGGPSKSGSNELTTFRGDVRLWMAKSRVSLGFRPSYDRVQKVKRFEFPVYFIRESKDLKDKVFDKGADFNGGISLGWKSSPEAGRQFYALFFVGSTFKLPGLP